MMNTPTRLAGTLAALAIAVMAASPVQADIEWIKDWGITYVVDAAGKTVGASIAGYSGTDTVISVPAQVLSAEHGWLPVLKIGDSAFERKTVTRVSLPSTVREIEDTAFYKCDALTSVEMTESVESIGYLAFAECGKLREINGATGLRHIRSNAFGRCHALETLPLCEGLESIGAGAFSFCQSICDVNIPDSVTNVTFAFAHCTSLTNAAFGTGCSLIGEQFTSDMTNLETLTIRGNGQTVVTENAFAGLSLREVAMTGVRTIQGDSLSAGSFRGCTNLVTVTVDAVLETIGTCAFSGCSKLRRVIGTTGLREIRARAFESCSSLEALPSFASLETIEYDAFRSCASLKEVDIPVAVTNVGTWAFEGCTGLTNITIAASYSPIEGRRFSADMPDLQTLTVRGNGRAVVTESAFAGFPMRHVVLSGIRTLEGSYGTGSFRGCTNLVTVTVDHALETIGDYTFYNCVSLSRVIGATGLRDIRRGAFERCSSLESLPLDEGLENIGIDTFNSCTSLREVDVPDSVTSIGVRAFGNCTGLTNIVLGTGYSPIAAGLFSTDMPDLQTLTVRGNGRAVVTESAFAGLPMRHVVLAGIRTLEGSYGTGSFRGCTNLVAVTTDCALVTIGEYAFKGCSALSEISLYGGLAVIEREAFFGCAGLTTVRLPSSKTALVKDALTRSGLDVSEIAFVEIEDPLPELPPGATSADVVEALSGAADPRLAANIADAATYNAFRAWAQSVPGGAAAARSSATAWTSFALDAAALLTRQPTDDDLTAVSFAPSSAAGRFDFVVNVKDVTVGGTATAANLLRILGIEGATTPNLKDFRPENATVDVAAPSDGNVRLTVGPVDADAPAFFMRARVNK